METWKNIPNTNNLYQISKDGNIRSLGRGWDCGLGWNINIKTKNLKKTINDIGYETVNIKQDNKRRLKYVHRLIAEAFIPNPLNKPNINHKNGVKADNRIDNLEWCTQSENIIHSYRNGFQIPKGCKGALNPRSKKVLCVQNGVIYNSTGEAGERLMANSAHIASVCRGERKTTSGYSFKYV